MGGGGGGYIVIIQVIDFDLICIFALERATSLSDSVILVTVKCYPRKIKSYLTLPYLTLLYRTIFGGPCMKKFTLVDVYC